MALGCLVEVFGVGDGQHSKQKQLCGVRSSSPVSRWDVQGTLGASSGPLPYTAKSAAPPALAGN